MYEHELEKINTLNNEMVMLWDAISDYRAKNGNLCNLPVSPDVMMNILDAVNRLQGAVNSIPPESLAALGYWEY